MSERKENQKGKTGLTFTNKLRYLALTLFILLGSGYEISSPTIRTEETKKSLTHSKLLIKRMFENHAVQNHYKFGEYLKTIYSAQDYTPLWTKGFAPTKQANDLLTFFENPKKFGLDSTAFSPHSIRQALYRLSTEKHFEKLTEARIKADLLISNTVLTTVVQITEGVQFSKKNSYTPDEVQIIKALANQLEEITTSTNIEESLLALHSENPHLRRLLNALEIYLIKHSGGNRLITIQENDSSYLHEVKVRFIKEGYLANGTSMNDSIMQQAIIRFQMQYGLSITGKLDAKTRVALNRPINYWVEKTSRTIEKMKCDSIKQEASVLVNIPAFKLYLFDEESKYEEYRVMVGTPKNQTPELTSKIDKFVTNPNWIVPKSITMGELIPKIKQDSTYLISRNFIIKDRNNNIVDHGNINWNEITPSTFEFILQQQPGLGNALGKIKFLFPNKYSVYLHDTPSRRLFASNYRAFSHGCVRIQHPQKFADRVLSELRRSEMYASVKPLIRRGITREITLEHPLPVYLRYYTVFSPDGESLNFYDDIYNLQMEQTKTE